MRGIRIASTYYPDYTTASTTTWVSYQVADLFSRLELAIINSYQEQRVLWYAEDKYSYLKIYYLKNNIQIPQKYEKMFIGRRFPIGG